MWQMLYSCYLAWQLSLPDYVIMRFLKSISPGFKLQYSLVAKPISVKRADRQTERERERDRRRTDSNERDGRPTDLLQSI